MSRETILLGFEVGTGEMVRVPFAHTVVCGLTQQSGKTTTLEGMLSRATRSGVDERKDTKGSTRPSLAFITKQAESAFRAAHRIPPYFRDRSDWQFVESILEAMMQERMKYERQWVIRVCKGARSLEDVAENTEKALHSTKSGYAEGMYLQLHEYFKIIMPELRKLKTDMGKRELVLEPGLNVMDLTEYSTEMQALSIASSLEKVYKMRGVITVIPEAWEYLPEGKNTPVKVAGISLIRKGAGGQNFMWLDSQDLASVDKKILKQVGVWIMGKQSEVNEVQKTLAQMPVSKKLKPQPEEIMQLRRGRFFVTADDVMKLVYVLPAWMPREVGLQIAAALPSSQGEEMILDAVQKYQPRPEREVRRLVSEALGDDPVKEKLAMEKLNWHVDGEDENVDYKAAFEEAQLTIQDLQRRLSVLEKKPAATVTATSGANAGESRPATPAPAGESMTLPAVIGNAGQVTDQMYAEMRARIFADRGLMLELVKFLPDVVVTLKRETISVDGKTIKGKIAEMLIEGWFESPRNGNQVWTELGRRAMDVDKRDVYPVLNELADWGFFRKEVQGNKSILYYLVPGSLDRVQTRAA